jgi:hypothetical protein
LQNTERTDTSNAKSKGNMEIRDIMLEADAAQAEIRERRGVTSSGRKLKRYDLMTAKKSGRTGSAFMPEPDATSPLEPNSQVPSVRTNQDIYVFYVMGASIQKTAKTDSRHAERRRNRPF